MSATWGGEREPARLTDTERAILAGAARLLSAVFGVPTYRVKFSPDHEKWSI